MATRQIRWIKTALLPAFAVIAFTVTGDKAQVSLKAPDLARFEEGDALTKNTAQYLINREVFTRQAIQLGRLLFHHDFALDKNSGCNGLPCAQRSPDATRSGPQSRFEAGSCVTCHNTPAGSAGFGDKGHYTFFAGNIVRSPDMFGAGLIQQLAIEASEDIKAADAKRESHVSANGVNYDV